MNLDHIPTPETYAALNSGKNWIQEVTDKSRDLERRLTVARHALACINASQIMDESVHFRIDQILTQTAPK